MFYAIRLRTLFLCAELAALFCFCFFELCFLNEVNWIEAKFHLSLTDVMHLCCLAFLSTVPSS